MGWFFFGDDEEKPEGKEERKEDLGDKVETIKKAKEARRDRLNDIMRQMPTRRPPKKKPAKK